jgi:replicative DNA helicase Mcm
VHITLKSEVNILAAANPKFGKFDSFKQIYEQLDLPPTLLTRFDAVFVVKDNYSEESDMNTAKTILLEENEPKEKEITPELMKKWIMYARTKKPVIEPKLQELIAKKYTEIRKRGNTIDGERTFPISPRQVPSIKRLSQARARMRLSDVVEKEDIEFAFKLIEYYLSKVGVDLNTGQIDIDMISTGITTSERGLIKKIKEVMYALEQNIGKDIPESDILVDVKGEFKDISDYQIFEALDKLRTAGEIFEPKKGIYRFVGN